MERTVTTCWSILYYPASGSADEAAQKFIIAEVVATWAEKSIVFHLRTRDIDHSGEIWAPYVMISYDGLCEWWMLQPHSHCNRVVNNAVRPDRVKTPERSESVTPLQLCFSMNGEVGTSGKILERRFLLAGVSAESSFDLQSELQQELLCPAEETWSTVLLWCSKAFSGAPRRPCTT